MLLQNSYLSVCTLLTSTLPIVTGLFSMMSAITASLTTKSCLKMLFSLLLRRTSRPLRSNDLSAGIYSSISSDEHSKYDDKSSMFDVLSRQVRSNCATNRYTSSIDSSPIVCMTPLNISCVFAAPNRCSLLSTNFFAASLMYCIRVFAISIPLFVY